MNTLGDLVILMAFASCLLGGGVSGKALRKAMNSGASQTTVLTDSGNAVLMEREDER